MKRDLILIATYIVMFLGTVIIGILIYPELTMKVWENPEQTAMFLILCVICAWVYGLARMFIIFYNRYREQ